MPFFDIVPYSSCHNAAPLICRSRVYRGPKPPSGLQNSCAALGSHLLWCKLEDNFSIRYVFWASSGRWWRRAQLGETRNHGPCDCYSTPKGEIFVTYNSPWWSWHRVQALLSYRLRILWHPFADHLGAESPHPSRYHWRWFHCRLKEVIRAVFSFKEQFCVPNSFLMTLRIFFWSNFLGRPWTVVKVLRPLRSV